MSSGCKGCEGALYGCPWEDEDISDCDDKAVIERMTKFANYCGRKEMFNEIKMLFKLAISEKTSRTINEAEAEIILRNVEMQIKGWKNETSD